MSLLVYTACATIALYSSRQGTGDWRTRYAGTGVPVQGLLVLEEVFTAGALSTSTVLEL